MISSPQQRLHWMHRFPAAKSAGNTELADSLSKARNQIGSVSVSASAGTVSVTPVTAPQITLPELNFEIERPDLSGLAAMQQKMSDIKSQYSDLQKTVAALMPQLETMQKQMQTITDNKAVVEQNLGAMQKLTAGVAQLDAGGSALYKGIGTLSAV